LPLPGDDDLIIREYLLGRLPENEAGRLDELSIADDDFALRLTAAENDLVDAYVRGELPAESLERFRSFYLASPMRREKVLFAETLLAHERRAASARPAAETVVSRADQASETYSRWSERRPGFLQLVPRWGFAAAVLILLLTAASLVVENRRLRAQITQTETERARLVQNQQALEKQLQEQRAAGAETAAKTQESATDGTPSKTLISTVPAFVLSPALRGGGEIPKITARAGTNQIRIKLQLETSDFSRYRVTLKDPASGRDAWHNAELTPISDGENKVVSFLLPANRLNDQNYVFEVSGITEGGTSEFITSYPFRFVVK